MSIYIVSRCPLTQPQNQEDQSNLMKLFNKSFHIHNMHGSLKGAVAKQNGLIISKGQREGGG